MHRFKGRLETADRWFVLQHGHESLAFLVDGGWPSVSVRTAMEWVAERRLADEPPAADIFLDVLTTPAMREEVERIIAWLCGQRLLGSDEYGL